MNLLQPQSHHKYSNSVFAELDKKGVTKIYYLPVYMRLNIKNFTKLCLQTLDSQMNATIILTVFYGGIDQMIVDQIKNSIVLQFNRDEPIRLIKDGLNIVMKHQKQNGMLHYTIRKKFTLRILSEVFYSPFELINLMLTITLQTVEILKLNPMSENENDKYLQQKECQVKFNLMTCDDDWTKISYSKEGTFGMYDLAEKKLQSQFTSEKSPLKLLGKKEKQNRLVTSMVFQSIPSNQKIKNMQYAHYTIPLYKYPGSSVATIFLPLFLLAAINLCIFCQQNNIADRIASISALAIAFVSLVPTIRKQLPPTPQITFVEYLVIVEAFTSFLCLVQTFTDLYDETDEYEFSDKFLIVICTIMSLAGLILVLIMFILHKKVWEKGYNDQPKTNQNKFDRTQWYNKISDKIFFSQSKEKLRLLYK